jgi:hypothetical protein
MSTTTTTTTDLTPEDLMEAFNDDTFDPSSSMSSMSTTSSFEQQRAAAYRCEISELKDVIQRHNSIVAKTQSNFKRTRSETKRLQLELKALTTTLQDVQTSKQVQEEQLNSTTMELKASRKRFRTRTRTLKTKIDQQSLAWDAMEAKCTAHEQARLKAERILEQSEQARTTSTTQVQTLEAAVLLETNERNKVLEQLNNERKVNEELRAQVDSAAVREANLRETASTLAGFQQELANACTATRTHSQELLARQTKLSKVLATQQYKYVALEKKYESYQCDKESMLRKKNEQERTLKRQLATVRVDSAEALAEHQKERDSHIKGQNVLRKTMEQQRKTLLHNKKQIFTLSKEIETAVQSRTDMELGLKSVRMKLDRREEQHKESMSKARTQDAQHHVEITKHKDDIENYKSALNISKQKQDQLEQERDTMTSKFAQMKSMLTHLADANGQVARVYGALGSRLTEVRAEQAAARGSLETTKEELLYLNTKIEEGAQQQIVDQTILKEKTATLVERGKRIQGLQKDISKYQQDARETSSKCTMYENRIKNTNQQKTKDDKTIIRLNAELVQQRNANRKSEALLYKTKNEVSSMKNERVTLHNTIQLLHVDIKNVSTSREQQQMEYYNNDQTKMNQLNASLATIHTLENNIIGLETQIAALDEDKRIALDQVMLEKNTLTTTYAMSQADNAAQVKKNQDIVASLEHTLKDRNSRVDQLQKERFEMMQQIQHNKTTSMSELRTLRKDVLVWKERCLKTKGTSSGLMVSVKQEQERSQGLQKLLAALREKGFEKDKNMYDQGEVMKQEVHRAELRARTAQEEVQQMRVQLAEREERYLQEVGLAERAARMAREEANAAHSRATRLEREQEALQEKLMQSSRSSYRSSTEHYPLGFHLGKQS